MSISFPFIVGQEASLSLRPFGQNPKGAESERWPCSYWVPTLVPPFKCSVSIGKGHPEGGHPLCPFLSACRHVHMWVAGRMCAPPTWSPVNALEVVVPADLSNREGLCQGSCWKKRRGRGVSPLISEEMSQIRFVNQKPIYNMQELICFIFLSYIFVKHI